MEYLILIYSLWNVLVFTLYGIDKHRARTRKWRISETTLILPAFLFGSVGTMLGMIVFNHKTSKTKFRIFIPLAFIVNILCVIAIEKWLGI